MFRLIPHRALHEPKAAVSGVREHDGQSTATLHIEGLVCSACAANVERHLRAVNGVESAEVDLASGEACVVYVASEASPDELVHAVEGSVWFPGARRLVARFPLCHCERQVRRQPDVSEESCRTLARAGDELSSRAPPDR